ncbi:LysR family transcriptional regulator [Chromohalobacter canadensis]|uniref:DNA-binding transcriptional regulator, LysR family n=1 Tax=Chromohalobacter canadensis TaxID=141389 RepID=A0A285VIK1_9GAMM|nr:LysR family transcriptional regulator [Chromohalobacter canadensis]MCT8468622.1 LysR family transcriptional regulator [Chromohalobacter canadensis]MCT8471677.1 LysR family transcriptional regulator [Chromohalobacter canadensis]MCT8499130.1 LysR family transcriptional regulator [Chromohalobacter canadensis]SOC53026.1 DNA-binding transcriptional regulator, LysR family [Chromohalobacter canadensis]
MHDLDELAAFASVMESGSLTASARELGVAKSTLSRRISQLEERLGQPLLRRQANRLLPTEAGTLFLAYSHQILRLAEQSQRALEDLRAEVSGELTVQVHNAFARGWFAQQMEDFVAHHPGVRLNLHTCHTPPAAPQDDALCVWLGAVDECGLRQETLGYMRRGLYAHPDYLRRHGVPQHPRDLAEHAWVDLLGTSEHGVTLHHAREGEWDLTLPPSRLRVDQYMLHIDAIARGGGLGILPHWMAEKRLQHHPGSLAPCLAEWAPSSLPITLLYPFGRLPRKSVTLLEQIRQTVPESWRLHSRIPPERVFTLD